METTSIILALQYISFTASVIMALLLVFSRIHTQRLSRSYERSRWMLFIAMSLYALHYQLQIHCGLRAKGDDVGALINIIFYSPAVYIISYVTLSMAGISQKNRLYIILSSCSFLAIMTTFILGWLSYHSLHMPNALYTMAGLFMATVVFFIVYPAREIRKRRNQIEAETASDLSNYNMYMTTGTFLLFTVAFLLPAIIFSSKLLIFIGPIFLVAILFYVFSFIALGFNQNQVTEMIDEEPEDSQHSYIWEGKDGNIGCPQDKIGSNDIRLIETAIAQFVHDHGYNDQNLTASVVARRLGISKGIFTQYLTEQKGQTFRVWLSNIRIEEAKRMLLTTSYNNETISIECGFSSRSWMQQKFKATTGMTPNEWKESQQM